MSPTLRKAVALFVPAMLAIASAGIGRGHDADSAAAPAPPPPPIAFVGALIRTQTDAGDIVGTLIVKDGKIAAMGRDVAIPADAQKINAAGFVITPGLFDAHCVLWLNAGAARESGNNGSLNILDGVDPFADDWREAARQGITAVYVQPGSGGTFGGNGAVLRVVPADSVDKLVIRSPAGVQATLGATPPAPPQQNNQLAEMLARFGVQAPQQRTTAPSSNSLTRYAQYEAFRGLFDAAKRYGESRTAERDAGKDLLLKALKRELPVRLETAHEDDVRNVLKMAADLGVNIVFDRLDRVKTLPEELAARKDGIVIGPVFGGKKSAEIRKLALDGRKFAIATRGDEPRATSWLRAHAAAAVAEGYPRDRVLQALTRDAAEMHGTGAKLGSLAVGRVADLAVFAGDPLDPATQVRMTICQGIMTYNAPKVEAHPAMAVAKLNLPEQLPASFVLKTSRLLNDAGEFVPGELFIEGGKVTSLSARNSAAPIIDVGNSPVTPGLVAADVVTVNENSPDADAAHLRAADGLMPDDPKLRGYRDAGFLTTIVVPGSSTVIAGEASATRAGEGGSILDCGLKFNLTAASRHNERYPASLIGQIELIGDRLRGEPSKTEFYMPASIAKAFLAVRDKNLAQVRNGRAMAYIDAQSRTEIRAALRLTAAHKLRAAIVGPKQTDGLIDEIRAAGVGVVIEPLRPHDGEKITRDLVKLSAAGIPLALGGGDAADLRNTAAWLVNAGMPRSTARRALVAHGADHFGLPAGCGRLSAGDAADFVIWDGDPLDPGARPTAVVCQGQRHGRGS